MIRYEGWEPLTTFAGVGEILDVLQGQQVDAVRVQMNAWASGGFDQAMAGSLSPLSVLGGKSGLKTLLETYTRPGRADGRAGVLWPLHHRQPIHALSLCGQNPLTRRWRWITRLIW